MILHAELIKNDSQSLLFIMDGSTFTYTVDMFTEEIGYEDIDTLQNGHVFHVRKLESKDSGSTYQIMDAPLRGAILKRVR